MSCLRQCSMELFSFHKVFINCKIYETVRNHDKQHLYLDKTYILDIFCNHVDSAAMERKASLHDSQKDQLA